MVESITINAPTQFFFTLSSSQQQHIVGELKKVVGIVSGGEHNLFFQHLCHSTQYGKEFILPTAQTPILHSIITNLKLLYHTSNFRDKPTLLSLIANLYSFNNLYNFGFDISQSQFSQAKNLNITNSTTLPNTSPPTPKSNCKLSHNKLETIIKSLLDCSKLSSACRVTPALKEAKFTSITYDPYAIYYIEYTFTKIYYKYIESNPINHVSKSCFFTYIPPNFKQPKKKSDMCKICLAHDQLKSQERKFNSIINQQTIQQNQTNMADAQKLLQSIHDKLKTVEGHKLIRDNQCGIYNNETNIQDTRSCVVILDFKENISLCYGPVETTQDFFHCPKASVLGFAVIYLQDSTKQTDYHTYFSKV